MNKCRIGDKVFAQTTDAENEILYSYCLLIIADEANRGQLDLNDIPICLAVLGRLDVGKNITVKQLDYLRDVADRAGLDTSRLDFYVNGSFRPGIGSDEMIAHNRRTRQHVEKAVAAHLERRTERSQDDDEQTPIREPRSPQAVLEGGIDVADLLPPTEEETINRFVEHLTDTLAELERRNGKTLTLGDQICLDDLYALQTVTLNLSEAHTKLAQAYGKLSTIFDRVIGVNKLLP